MGDVFILISIIIIQTLIIGMLYKLFKTIAHPAVFFQSYITVQIVFGIIAFKEHNYNYSGIAWILCALFAFSVGSLLASGLRNKNPIQANDNCSYSIKLKLAKDILIMSILLGLCYSIELIIRNGFSLRQLFNIDELLQINNSMAIQRYSGRGVGMSKISRLFLVFTYFAPLIGGFNLNFVKDNKSKFFCWISLLPSFSILLIQNTKATWIGAVFLFISGYLTSCVKINNKLPKISFKKIMLIIICIFMFLGINYASMMMRIGRFDKELVNIINRKFLNYALGHIPAFDIWFSNNIRAIEYHFGTRTFYGIADFVGISKRVQGIYTDFVSWGSYSTNVYTAFRPFIEDFGPYLGLSIMFLYGFIMDIIFFYVINQSFRYKGVTILSAFYFYTLFTITSAWSYMSFILAFVIFNIYIKNISIPLDEKQLYKGEAFCVNNNLT